MASLSSPGIGSGLDVNSLVSQLMTVERAPIALLATKTASFQAKLSAYGTLKSSLAALQTAAKAISTPATFSPITAGVADASVLSANASATAVAGSYDVEVVSLAQSQKLMMSAPAGAGYAALDSIVGTGTININFGSYSTAVPPAFATNPDKLTAIAIPIGSDNNTLAGVRDAINAANAGVSAAIINDGNGFRLSLTSTDTGARNAMQISVDAPATGSIGSLGQLNYNPASAGGTTYAADGITVNTAGSPQMGENVKARDAIIKIDNVTITKQSNTITDAIQGVTLNLSRSTATGTTTKLTLNRDTSNVKAAIDGFIKAYNDTTTAMKAATAFDAAAGKGAVLTGDSTMRAIQTQLRGLFAAPVAGAPSGLAMLSDIGISFQKDGSLLKDNPTKFDAALADPGKDLSKLFATSAGGKGYAYQMDVLIGKILSPVGPMVDRTNSFSKSVKDIGTQTDTINARLVNVEKRYRAQYTALDTMVASMTTTSTFLTQQLAALAKSA